MVGFKTIWLLLTLLIFAACVPQTKQTECKSNEAFNAALRTCVPVVNGPSSFINIDSFLPTSPLTKYKSDPTPITFSVVISNPYAQTYSVTWERIYNGVPIPIAPTTPTSYTFAPLLLASEVGTHIISVKIKDATNAIVDSHSFELKINDNPKPVINSGSIWPAIYHSPFTPYSTAENFKFTVNNNGASMIGAGYRTEWSIYRNSSLIDSQTDTFPTAGGDLSSSGSNYPQYVFSPATLGVGSYLIRARVTNNALEIVAEQQWTATVSHPPMPKVSSRNTYSVASGQSVAYNQTIVAYNGVPYTSAPAYNFVPLTQTQQANFCVTLSDGDGTYALDNKFVFVDYYLDGSTFIYRGITSIADPEVCLSDSPAALAAFLFMNPTSTAAFPHTLVAQVIDERTNQAYTASDMGTGLPFPISWSFDVRPQNKAPSVSFGSLTTLSCPGSSTNTKSACTVASDTNFSVRINMTGDDFYTLPADEANFDYNIVLYRNNVPYQTCSKSDPGYTGLTDMNGADGYECVFNIESYDGAGPIDLSAQTYKIQAEISDNGSPIIATGMTSATLNWVFAPNGVSETNLPATTISSWSVSGVADEGSNITFTADIVDPQRDNHTYEIKYCPDAGCSTPVTLTSGSITRTNNVNPHTLTVNYSLPEDFLLGLTSLGCHTLKRGNTCAVNFFIEVKDLPDTATPSVVTSAQMASVIKNINPAPTLNTAFSNPAPSVLTATTAFAFVGMPITIANAPASILVDTSSVNAEKSFRYQWYIKNNTSVTTYQPIDGATSENLVWTPSLIKEANLATDNPLSLILCVEDHPTAAVATPNPTDSTCNNATPWVITVRNNFKIAHDLSSAPSSTELATASGDKGKETAIWYDTPSTFNGVTSSAAYIAMIGNDQQIHVKKVLVRDREGIDSINPSQIVSIYAVPTGTVAEIKDLSITGNGNELYIAYLASRTGNPASFYPQVRRIDLSATAVKNVPNNHAGKFGFDYDGLAFTNSCSPAGDCQATTGSGVETITFSPTGVSITGSFLIGTPNGNFSVNFGTYNGVNTICSTCNGNTMAQNLTDIINNSVDPLLAGYSATQAGNQVLIHGASANDYFDASTHGFPRNTSRLGKIYVAGAAWFLPFIDNVIGGSHTGKISFYSAATGGKMDLNPVGILDAFSHPDLANLNPAVKFDNYVEGNNLWIALISQSGSAGKLYKLDSATMTFIDSDDVFSGSALIDIQVAASSSNVFIGTTAAVGSTKMLGVYDNNGNDLDEFNMDNALNLDPSSVTEDFFNTSAVTSYRIVPYGTEARIFAASKGLSPASYKLYVARLRTVMGTWTLSCGDCTPISEIGQNISPHVSIGAAPIRDNPSPLYRLATDGAIGNQGVKDVAFVSMGRLDSAAPGSCDPAIGVFNVEGEAIGSSLTYQGPVTNEDAGLFRAPIIKN